MQWCNSKKIFLLLPLFLFVSCATTRFSDGTDYSDDLRNLQRQLSFRPDDPGALRDIGVIYFQTKQYPLAKGHLARAYEQIADDPRTVFYYGMTLEYLADIESALGVYIKYTDLSPSSQFRRLIEARFRTLTRQLVQQEVRAILAAEQRLNADSLSPTAVAVFSLKYQGTDPKYEALGKGVSEMILVDLAQVKRLTVLERIRVEELVNELKMGQSVHIDKATAPRLGKLLSAGRVVAGTFNVYTWNLRMDVTTWDVVNKKSPDFKTESDGLDNLFKMEKRLVFGIIEDLGITLTPEEQQAITRVPTRNAIAFITYCLGLKSEDALDFQAASKHYRQAAALDPEFALASIKAASAEGMVLAGGAKENALNAAEAIDPQLKLKKKGRVSLLTQRLIHSGAGVGSGFQPGQDDRKPAQEGFSILPEPPRPPGQ